MEDAENDEDEDAAEGKDEDDHTNEGEDEDMNADEEARTSMRMRICMRIGRR